MKEYTVLDGEITCLRNRLYDEAYRRGYEEKAKEIRDGEYTFYEKGLEDAWECARKLHKYKTTEIMEIFGLIGLTLGDGCRNEVIQNCSVYEAMQKIKDYEERQTETETWISMDKSRKITVPKGTFEKILSDADDDFDI